MTYSSMIETYKQTLRHVSPADLNITRVRSNKVHGLPFELMDEEFVFEVKRKSPSGYTYTEFHADIDEELIQRLCESALLFNADWPRAVTGGKRVPNFFVDIYFDDEDFQYDIHWEELAKELGREEEFEEDEVTTVEMMVEYLDRHTGIPMPVDRDAPF